MLVIVEHATLAEIVARPVEFLDQRIFGGANLFVQFALAHPVQGTQGRRTLEHQVFEKMSGAVLAGRLVESPHVGEDLADDPILAGPFDDQQP